ncbi:hypothetical protein D3C76_567180 [compost metagenome]
MDKAQQRLATVIAVIAVHILGESDQRLILPIKPMPDLKPHLGHALMGVVDALAVDT